MFRMTHNFDSMRIDFFEGGYGVGRIDGTETYIFVDDAVYRDASSCCSCKTGLVGSGSVDTFCRGAIGGY